MSNLEFKDKEDITYRFDNDSGLLFENLLTDDTEQGKYNKKYLENLDRYLNKIYKVDNSKINDEDLEKYYNSNGFNELLFKLTDQCNMRCKYCIYSEFYPYTDSYNDATLSAETAIKGVDKYMHYFRKNLEVIPDKTPVFGFYGGEPLMCFEVIKKIVEYIELKYKDNKPNYTITTNGLLLKRKDIADFLKKYGFWVCVSLDAYPENHNRNRVDRNKNPTYSIINEIIEENFKNYNDIFTLCCIDTKTDLKELYKYYSTNDRLNGGNIPHALRFSFISDIGTNYYKQFTKEDSDKFRRDYDELKNKYIENAINNTSDWILDLLIGQEYLRIYDRIKFRKGVGFYKGRTGTCIPGDKLYILPDGNIGICEKVYRNDLIIGNVVDGLNYPEIIKIISNYNSMLDKQCKNCNISSLCDMCYTHLIEEGKFLFNKDICERRRKNFMEKFSEIIYIEKRNPGFFENKINSRILENRRSKNQIIDY